MNIGILLAAALAADGGWTDFRPAPPRPAAAAPARGELAVTPLKAEFVGPPRVVASPAPPAPAPAPRAEAPARPSPQAAPAALAPGDYRFPCPVELAWDSADLATPRTIGSGGAAYRIPAGSVVEWDAAGRIAVHVPANTEAR